MNVIVEIEPEELPRILRPEDGAMELYGMKIGIGILELDGKFLDGKGVEIKQIKSTFFDKNVYRVYGENRMLEAEIIVIMKNGKLTQVYIRIEDGMYNSIY